MHYLYNSDVRLSGESLRIDPVSETWAWSEMVPPDTYEFHGRAYPLPLPEFADKTSIATKLRNEWAPMLKEIYGGYSEDWDGNNMVGELTDEAQAALEQLGAAILEETYDPEDEDED